MNKEVDYFKYAKKLWIALALAPIADLILYVLLFNVIDRDREAGLGFFVLIAANLYTIPALLVAGLLIVLANFIIKYDTKKGNLISMVSVGICSFMILLSLYFTWAWA